jgi:hypothetical protein
MEIGTSHSNATGSILEVGTGYAGCALICRCSAFLSFPFFFFFFSHQFLSTYPKSWIKISIKTLKTPLRRWTGLLPRPINQLHQINSTKDTAQPGWKSGPTTRALIVD